MTCSFAAGETVDDSYFKLCIPKIRTIVLGERLTRALSASDHPKIQHGIICFYLTHFQAMDGAT